LNFLGCARNNSSSPDSFYSLTGTFKSLGDICALPLVPNFKAIDGHWFFHETNMDPGPPIPMPPIATSKRHRRRRSLLLYVVTTRKRVLMRKIYVSDNGNDSNDGLSEKTPIRSWQRFITLCEGNDEIIIMGN